MISEWLGIPAAFVAWSFALYVYAVAPPTRGARFLVAMLIIDGLAVITGYSNLDYLNPFLAENVLSSQFGTVLGVLGTGTLVFFLDPIQRAAEKLSDAAMPNTLDTPEYETFRKLQVYETAVQAALEDGHISKRQRRVLDSMIQSMCIDTTTAERMENDARTAPTN